MKIIKIKNCYECPYFDKTAYLHNQEALCNANFLLKFCGTDIDVYKEVHRNCLLEENN